MNYAGHMLLAAYFDRVHADNGSIDNWYIPGMIHLVAARMGYGAIDNSDTIDLLYYVYTRRRNY